MNGADERTAPERTRDPLWRQANFRRLWIGQTVSRFGSMVSELALPLAAILVVHAPTFQVGLLAATETVPFLIVGLPVGAWVDRLRTRQVLIISDLLRFVALGSIPLSYALGDVSMAQLYIAAFVTGVCTVFFDVGFQTILPELVERAELVDGNAKLQTSESIAQIAGPSLGGVLIQLLSAPYAILIDAVSFLWSAVWVRRIDVRSAPPQRAAGSRLRTEIAEGLRFVLGNRLLRSIVACTAISNLFNAIGLSIFFLFLARTLSLSPGVIGLIPAIGSVGALLASVLAQRISRRFGIGPTIWMSALAGFPAALVTPFVHRDWTLLLLALGQALWAASIVTYNITQVSLRQAICPPELLGRMNATVRFVVRGVMPIGAVIGGVLGTWLGLRPTLLISAVGVGLAFLPVFFSPVREMRSAPAVT